MEFVEKYLNESGYKLINITSDLSIDKLKQIFQINDGMNIMYFTKMPSTLIIFNTLGSMVATHIFVYRGIYFSIDLPSLTNEQLQSLFETKILKYNYCFECKLESKNISYCNKCGNKLCSKCSATCSKCKVDMKNTMKDIKKFAEKHKLLLVDVTEYVENDKIQLERILHNDKLLYFSRTKKIEEKLKLDNIEFKYTHGFAFGNNVELVDLATGYTENIKLALNKLISNKS